MIFLSEIDGQMWAQKRCVKFMCSDWNNYMHSLTKQNCKDFQIFKRERIWGFPLHTHVLTIMDTRNGSVRTYQARVKRRN